MRKISKSFGFRKKEFGFDIDTKIGPWFWFPIPKPGFGHRLLATAPIKGLDLPDRLTE